MENVLPLPIRPLLDCVGLAQMLGITVRCCPARISELTTLRNPDDVFIADRYLSHRDENNKTGRGRILTIPKSMVEYFAGIPADCPWVFFIQHGDEYCPIQRSSLYTWLDRTAKDLNVKRVNIHAFRRTCAVRALESGIDLGTLSELTGHRSMQLLKDRYLPLMNTHRQAATMKLETYLDAAKHGQNMDKNGKGSSSVAA